MDSVSDQQGSDGLHGGAELPPRSWHRAGLALPLVLVGAVACSMLVYNMLTAGSRRQGRRYWIDTAVAVKLYLDYELPPGPGLGEGRLDRSIRTCERIVSRLAERIPREQFWRVVPIQPFVRNRAVLASPPLYEDPGRALALAWGFRLLGGIAPHLLPWLGVLASLPILAWAIGELWTGGQPGAATLFGLLAACSPYVVQCLSLGYSPFGFYLVALLALVALSAHATLARRISSGGLLTRALACGIVFAICVLCRGGTLLLGPGFVLALLAASGRVSKPLSRSATALLVLGALTLFALPCILVRQSQHHVLWAGLWEGLGDFDRSKGYYWADQEAMRVLQTHGLPASWVALSGPQAETFFRRQVLADIRSDPGWYVGILARRIVATVFQSKLWPWGPRDGGSFAPSVSPHEGQIDQYYRFTQTVDFVGVGALHWELPISLVVAPTLLLASAGIAGRRLGLSKERQARFRSYLRLLGCLTLAALAAPVLITTASALETQAFGLVCFLGLGLCLDEVLFGLRSRTSGATSGSGRGAAHTVH